MGKAKNVPSLSSITAFIFVRLNHSTPTLFLPGLGQPATAAGSD
jgi:hypothetical protein